MSVGSFYKWLVMVLLVYKVFFVNNRKSIFYVGLVGRILSKSVDFEGVE